MSDDQYTTIRITEADRDRLLALGYMGETMDELIGSLLDEVEAIRTLHESKNPEVKV